MNSSSRRQQTPFTNFRRSGIFVVVHGLYLLSIFWRITFAQLISCDPTLYEERTFFRMHRRIKRYQSHPGMDKQSSYSYSRSLSIEIPPPWYDSLRSLWGSFIRSYGFVVPYTWHSARSIYFSTDFSSQLPYLLVIVLHAQKSLKAEKSSTFIFFYYFLVICSSPFTE